MLVFCQTFQYDSWRLLQIGDHLQVEVTRLQDSPVNRSQLDYNLLMNTQGPALMAKQQATVLNLWRKKESVFSIRNRPQLKLLHKGDQCFSFTAVAIEQLNLGPLAIGVGEFSILQSSL